MGINEEQPHLASCDYHTPTFTLFIWAVCSPTLSSPHFKKALRSLPNKLKARRINTNMTWTDRCIGFHSPQHFQMRVVPTSPQSLIISPNPLCSASHTPSPLPAVTCLDTTSRGSVSCSGLMRLETAEEAVISLKRLLPPCVDSFSKEVTFCVDSFRRSETVGANLLWPFKSLLSMLFAKRIEFKPARKRGKSGVSAVENPVVTPTR